LPIAFLIVIAYNNNCQGEMRYPHTDLWLSPKKIKKVLTNNKKDDIIKSSKRCLQVFSLYKRNKDNLTFERLVATNPDGYEIRKNYQKSIDIATGRCYNKYIR